MEYCYIAQDYVDAIDEYVCAECEYRSDCMLENLKRDGVEFEIK